MPFVPLSEQDEPTGGFVPQDRPRRGFVPLAAEPEQPSIAGQVLLNNPLTAAGEAALNLGSQAVALPVAAIVQTGGGLVVARAPRRSTGTC